MSIGLKISLTLLIIGIPLLWWGFDNQRSFYFKDSKIPVRCWFAGAIFTFASAIVALWTW